MTMWLSKLEPGFGFGFSRPGGAAPGVSPYDLSGLVIAHDGQRPNWATYDGSNLVSNVVNFAGIANSDAAQSSAALKPLYVSGGLNGLDAILADGFDDRLVYGAGALPLSNGAMGWTDVVVGKWSSFASAAAYLTWMSTGGNVNSVRCCIGTDASNTRRLVSRRLDGDGAVTSLFGTANTEPSVVVAARDYSNAKARWYENGTLIAELEAGTTGTVSATSSQGMQLFVASNSSNPANYLLGARFSYNRALTPDEVSAISKRLGFEWLISIS